MTNRQAAKNAKSSLGSFGDLGVLGGLAVLLSSNTEIGHYSRERTGAIPFESVLKFFHKNVYE